MFILYGCLVSIYLYVLCLLWTANEGSLRKLLRHVAHKKQLFGSKGQKMRDGRELLEMLLEAGRVIGGEPGLLDLAGPVLVVADIHGQLFDLLKIFAKHRSPPEQRYLFLGDYVDRGEYGLEVLALLFAFKVLFPAEIYLLRGNHEEAAANESYGFKEECMPSLDYIHSYA